MPRLLPWLLFVGTLIALAVSLSKPDEVALRMGLGERLSDRQDELWQRRLRAHYRRVDAGTPAGAVVLLGDSNVQGFSASRVTACTASFGIGGETSAQLLARIGDYRSPDRAAAIVVLTGLNDVLHGADAELDVTLRRLLAAFPADRPLLLSSLPRLAPESAAGRAHGPAVARANTLVAAACRARHGCRFVDLHGAMAAPAALMEPDGIHLNPAGQALWARLLREALTGAGVADRGCAG